MKAYSGYADWIRHSNSAARFREAFALADQMDPPLKMACVEKIYRIANSEWETVKDLFHAPFASIRRHPVVSLEQIARDIRDGTFPAKSEKTLREEVVSKIAMSSLDVGAPGLSAIMKQAIARSIAMKVVDKLDDIIAVSQAPSQGRGGAGA